MRREYWHPDYGSVSPQDIRDSDELFQKEVMKNWFFSNFERPVESTPYESREGGYVYIRGGPYEAGESLYDEFGLLVSEGVIIELAEEIEEQQQCYEWARAPGTGDYIDDYLIFAIQENTEFRESFERTIEYIRALLDIDLYDEALRQNLWRLLHVNVISAMETYLSDAFFHTTLADTSACRRFVETNPHFRKEKFHLSEIFETMEALERDVKAYLSSVIYHNLAKVKPMYEQALQVEFPRDLSDIFRAIQVRHDIVHRCGRSKDGKMIKLDREDVTNLVGEVVAFVDFVDGQLVEDYGDVL